MSALALAPRKISSAFRPAPPPLHGAAGPLERYILMRYDPSGKIRWMNAAARAVFGQAAAVSHVLASEKKTPALASFPLGDQWLWLGSVERRPAASLGDRVARVNLLLAEVHLRRGARYLQLLRAQGIFQQQRHRFLRGHGSGLDAAGPTAALEQERDRIARELHDHAGQSLVGVLLNLEIVERHLSPVNREGLARLASCRKLASQALEQIRRLSHELHAPDWTTMEFGESVESLVETMGLRSKLRVEIGEIHIPRGLPPAVKTALYRVLQEALSNVLRHAGARTVVIHAPPAANGVALVIQDDGAGFDPAAPKAPQSGIGLAGIRRRIESVGGTLRISAAPGHGVRLGVWIPWREELSVHE
jgi:signal transduction histidine kinase